MDEKEVYKIVTQWIMSCIKREQRLNVLSNEIAFSKDKQDEEYFNLLTNMFSTSQKGRNDYKSENKIINGSRYGDFLKNLALSSEDSLGINNYVKEHILREDNGKKTIYEIIRKSREINIIERALARKDHHTAIMWLNKNYDDFMNAVERIGKEELNQFKENLSKYKHLCERINDDNQECAEISKDLLRFIQEHKIIMINNIIFETRKK